MEINPRDLADISMLVEQRNLDHAQFLAQEQLLLHPNSAAIHALMGDIAAARHNPREAIDWYELALRLEHNPQVATRLDRQRALLDQQSEAEIDQLLARPPDARRRLMFAIIGGFVAVGLLVLLIAALVPRHRPAQREAQPAMVGRPGVQAGAAQPGVTPTPPSTAGGTGANRPAASALRPPGAPAVGPAPATGRSINVTRSVDAPMSDRDRLLTQGLSGITWPSGEALGWRVQAAVDDYTGYVMITVQIPPGMPATNLSDMVIDMAYRLAVAATQADKGVQSMTIRMLADVEVEDHERTLVAFRGNTSRDYLDYYLKRGIQPDRQTIWQNVFATTWWNPSVPSGVETTGP